MKKFYVCIKVRVESLVFKVKGMLIEIDVDNIGCMLGAPRIISSSNIFEIYVGLR